MTALDTGEPRQLLDVERVRELFDLRGSFVAIFGGAYEDDPYVTWNALRERAAVQEGTLHELSGITEPYFWHGLPYPDRPHFTAFTYSALDAAYRNPDVFASSEDGTGADFDAAPNVVVPAWEFPDVPDHEFDGDPRNDWVRGANRSSLVVVSGPFTANALRKAGVRSPIRIVQVPVASDNFELDRWAPERHTVLDCPAYVFPQAHSGGGRTVSLDGSGRAAGPSSPLHTPS